MFAALHYGHDGEMKLGVHIDPVPAIPQLANSIDIKPPLVDTGLTLRVSL